MEGEVTGAQLQQEFVNIIKPHVSVDDLVLMERWCTWRWAEDTVGTMVVDILEAASDARVAEILRQFEGTWRYELSEKIVDWIWGDIVPVEEDEEGETPEIEVHATDLGNSIRLVQRHGRDLRHVKEWGWWMAWNGQIWERGAEKAVVEKAKETVLAIYHEAAELQDSGERKELARWAAVSESGYHIHQMVRLAESDRRVCAGPQDFDSNPWLLNVQNGTVDLRTGQLMAHRREDYITKVAPVVYEPMATCPRWAQFLLEIMGNSQELVQFLQRAVGHCLTGDVREDAFFVLWGRGDNGKTTFVEAIVKMLGKDDYAHSASASLLLAKRFDCIPNDVAPLKGRRFVAACETQSGGRLDESLVKRMTGGDTLAARYLYSEWFSFDPQFKLWLSTNHKPEIRGMDHAIWRRVKLIPFNVQFRGEKADKDLPRKLEAELSGILNWAIEGCLAWQRQGLGVPDEVVAATDSYKSEMDILAPFIEEECKLIEDKKAQAGPLYKRYKDWCFANGEKAVSSREFSERLLGKGYVRVTEEGHRYYMGLELKPLPTYDESGGRND